MRVAPVNIPRSRDPAWSPSPEPAAEPAGSTPAGVALGPLPHHIGYALRRAQLAVFGDFIAMLEQVALRPAQFSVLVIIGENPGIVQRSVCETLFIKPANFVPLFAGLARRGLTRRVAIDGRSKGLYLTPKGRTLTAEAERLCAVHQERISAKIGADECRRLTELLFRIAELDVPANAPADGASPGLT